MTPEFRSEIIGALLLCLSATTAAADWLTVLPVTIQMAPGEMAASLTVKNEADATARCRSEPLPGANRPLGEERLDPTTELMASPPICTIAAGVSQVVRLVLRRPPQGGEASYRIRLDQIPPPAAPGTERIALRLPIPIFAEPNLRAAPHLRWRIEAGAHAALVAANDGNRHEKVLSISLLAVGQSLPVAAGASPFISLPIPMNCDHRS